MHHRQRLGSSRPHLGLILRHLGPLSGPWGATCRTPWPPQNGQKVGQRVFLKFSRFSMVHRVPKSPPKGTQRSPKGHPKVLKGSQKGVQRLQILDSDNIVVFVCNYFITTFKHVISCLNKNSNTNVSEPKVGYVCKQHNCSYAGTCVPRQ